MTAKIIRFEENYVNQEQIHVLKSLAVTTITETSQTHLNLGKLMFFWNCKFIGYISKWWITAYMTIPQFSVWVPVIKGWNKDTVMSITDFIRTNFPHSLLCNILKFYWNTIKRVCQKKKRKSFQLKKLDWWIWSLICFLTILKPNGHNATFLLLKFIKNRKWLYFWCRSII